MQRYDYLKAIAADAGDALVVAAGWAAREWQALRPGDGNFRPRTLGLASSISLGIALGLPERKVIAIDGDGAFLMNLCGLPTIAINLRWGRAMANPAAMDETSPRVRVFKLPSPGRSAHHSRAAQPVQTTRASSAWGAIAFK